MSKYKLLKKISIGIASLALTFPLAMGATNNIHNYLDTPTMTAHADVDTIVHNAFTKHGARKVGIADDDGVKGPIYEVIRNGEKIDWDSNDMTIKVNGHNPKQNSNGDAIDPIVKLVDSSSQYNNTSSNKPSKPKVSNKPNNKINKNKAIKSHKSKNNSKNNSKSITQRNKPVKHTAKKSNHKSIGLVASVIVIVIIILGIIGGIKHHHNKERDF